MAGEALDSVGRDLRAPRAAGVAGLAFAVLFTASLLLLQRSPGPGSTAESVEAWYLGDGARHLALVGLYLAPFCGIAFLWFMAVIRNRVGEREDMFFSTVFAGSGLLFVAMWFAAAAAVGAPLAAVRFQDAPAPSPDVVVLSRGLGYTLLFVYAVRVAAVFMIVASTIGIRTRTMPRWLVVAGYAIAVVMLSSVSFVRPVVFLFPAWVATVSVVILLARRSRDATPAGAVAAHSTTVGR
jgi:hypothetical protein